MFGTLGGPELFLILIIALIVFGPRKLPEVGKSIGKMLVEFRRASTDFKRTIEGEIEAEKRPQPPDPPAVTPTPASPAVPEGTIPNAAVAAEGETRLDPEPAGDGDDTTPPDAPKAD